MFQIQQSESDKKGIKGLSLIGEKIKAKIDDAAKSSLPDEYKNISKKQAYGFLFLTQASALAVFVYFCYQSYIVQIKAVFLALDKTSGICYEVPKSFSGVFYASDSGAWQGTDSYKPNEGIYRFQFANLLVTGSEFSDLLQEFNDKHIKPLSQSAKSAASQYNLLNLIYYSAKINRRDFVQKLDFITDPRIIFAGKTFLGLLNKKFLYTGMPDRIDYDKNTGRLTYNFDLDKAYKESLNGYHIDDANKTISQLCLMDEDYYQGLYNYFSSDSNLLDRYVSYIDYPEGRPRKNYWSLFDIIDPGLFNFDEKFGYSFDLEYDLVALTSAVAVNLGILDFDDLIDSGYGSKQFSYKGVTYVLGNYIVDKYSYMTPIMCLSKLSGSDPTALHPFDHYCFVKLGSYENAYLEPVPMLGVPSFMHRGYNPLDGIEGTQNFQFYPTGPFFSKCTCPLAKFYKTNMVGRKTDVLQDSECNLVAYFSSLAFFPDSNLNREDASALYYKSGPKKYCEVFNDYLGDVECYFYTNIVNCPEKDVQPSTEAFLKCANDIYVVIYGNFDNWLLQMQVGPVIDLVTQYSAYDMNEAIYSASITTIGPFYIPNLDGTNCPDNFMGPYDTFYKYYSPTSFCNDSCTVIVTTSESGYLSSFAVNDFLRQQPYISCNDTFSRSDEALSLIKSSPPVELIEQYVKCSTKPVDAIQNAIGIATGWVGLIIPILVTIVLSLVSCYYARFVGEMPQTDEDIREADLNEKLSSLDNRCEVLKRESQEKNLKLIQLQNELKDAKQLSAQTQADLHKVKQEKEKEKQESSEIVKTITFGLI